MIEAIKQAASDEAHRPSSRSEAEVIEAIKQAASNEAQGRVAEAKRR